MIITIITVVVKGSDAGQNAEKYSAKTPKKIQPKRRKILTTPLKSSTLVLEVDL